MKNQLYIKHILGTIFMILMILTMNSCSSKKNNSNDASQGNIKYQDAYFGQMSAIPITKDSSTYKISLYNSTSTAITFNQNEINLIGAKLKDPTIKVIDISNCTILQAHGECSVNITLANNIIDSTGHFGLQIKGHQHTKTVVANTVISYFTPNLDNKSGVIVNTSDIGQSYLNTNNSIDTNIPIYFSKTFNGIHIDNLNPNIHAQLLGCNTMAIAGSACTLRLNLTGGKNQNTLVKLLGEQENSQDTNATIDFFHNLRLSS